MTRLSRLSRFAALAVVLVALPLLAGCGSKLDPATPGATPQTQTLQRADAVLVRLAELQTAAIDANRTGGITDRDAILVVRFTQTAGKIVHDVPNGWQPAVLTAYAELKTNLPPPVRERFSLLFTLLDALIAAR